MMKKIALVFLFTLWLLAFISISVNAQDHSHEHSHDHSHDHSHSHSHSHTHTAPKEQKAKVPPSSKYEVDKTVSSPTFTFIGSDAWSQALFATALIGVAPILILFVVPLISTDSKGNR